jgi:hypothetical protein
VTTPSQSYALKFHLHLPQDPRDRQQTETQALTFLNQHDITQVPRLIAQDRKNHCSLLEWIDGTLITSASSADMDQTLSFISQLHKLGKKPQAQKLPLASAATLSGASLESQVKQRLAQLQAGDNLTNYPYLAPFIEEQFTPLLKQTLAQTQSNYQKANLDFYAHTPKEYQILSPSDFGFHNTLRLRDNRLVFLDFEYFGWDDPVKLVCDFLFHPGMALSQKGRSSFQQGIVALCKSDSTLPFRIQHLTPLFGLCWCLIILNEFTPVGWQRRATASEQPLDQKTIQAQQLHKAQCLLATLDKRPTLS